MVLFWYFTAFSTVYSGKFNQPLRGPIHYYTLYTIHYTRTLLYTIHTLCKSSIRSIAYAIKLMQSLNDLSVYSVYVTSVSVSVSVSVPFVYMCSVKVSVRFSMTYVCSFRLCVRSAG